jgi:hypothetical protein
MKQKYAAHIAQRLNTSVNVNDMLSQIRVNAKHELFSECVSLASLNGHANAR